MVNKNGKGGFKPLSAELKEKIRTASLNPENVTYSDIARAANVSRPTAIKHVLANGLRPKGNNLPLREVKQPSVARRLAQRQKKMEMFILECALKGSPVGVNLLRERFGGTKAAAREILLSVEKKLISRDAPLLRLEVVNRVAGNGNSLSPLPKVPKSKVVLHLKPKK